MITEKGQISKYSPKKTANPSGRNMENNLGSEIKEDIFHFVQKPYNLRNDSTLLRQRNRAINFGTERISFLAPKSWEIDTC